jgi:predicted ribonuclease YlaK
MTITHKHTKITITNNQDAFIYAAVRKLAWRGSNSRVIMIVRSLLLRERAQRKTIEKYHFDQADSLLYRTGTGILENISRKVDKKMSSERFDTG